MQCKFAAILSADALAMAFSLLLLAGCGSPQTPLPTYHGDPRIVGSVASVEPVGSYPAIELRVLLWIARLPESVPISDGADLYRITYWSRSDGKPVLLSGLMGMPGSGKLRGTVVYMHGTILDRKGSVSRPSFPEGLIVSSVFAGGGFLLLAPDLRGLGVSHGTQPYLYTPDTVEQSLDFLRAAQTVCKDLGQSWSSDIYIAGFSQGGHAAAAVQRVLEKLSNRSWQVRAGAGIAGPYDVLNVEFPFAMKGASSFYSLYLAHLALSYSTYYHQALGSVLKPAFVPIVPLLFDGDHADGADKKLPANPRELFTQQFLTAYDNRQTNWFLDAAAMNEAYAWTPVAPFRAYYGDKDQSVAPENAKFFAREAGRHGGHVEAISVGPQDHTGSGFQALPMIRRWFDQLSASSNGSH